MAGERPSVGSSSSRILRVGGERARDRYHLALATGELRPSALAIAFQSWKDLVGERNALVRPASNLARPGRHFDILGNGQFAEHFALLGGKTDARSGNSIWTQADDRGAVELDRARERPVHAHDGAECRGLAGTVAADETHELAGPYLQGDAAQDGASLNIDYEVANGEHQCFFRLPTTISITAGSAKNAFGGRSASTLPSDSAMMRWE